MYLDKSLVIKITAGILFILILFATYKIVLPEDSIKLDSLTQCPTDKDLTKNYTVILIDETTGFQEFQRKMLSQNIMSLVKYEMLKPYESVSIFVVNDKPRAIEPIFQKCFPSIDESQINVEVLKDEYLEPFKQELLSISKEVFKPTKTAGSPLIEWIREILERNEFKDKTVRLIIYSDMIENTKKLSLYPTKEQSKYNFSKNTTYDFWKSHKKVSIFLNNIEIPDIKDLSLAVIQLESGTMEHSLKVKKFWIDFLNDKGISLDPRNSCRRNDFIDCWEIK